MFKSQTYKSALKLSRCKIPKISCRLSGQRFTHSYILSPPAASSKDISWRGETSNISRKYAPALLWILYEPGINAGWKLRLNTSSRGCSQCLPSQLKQWFPWRSINLVAQPGCSSVLRLRAQSQCAVLWSCSPGEGFDSSAQHRFSGTENHPGPSPLCQEPGWFCLEAAWGCSCGFLGLFLPEQAELCGTLPTPVSTIPTPNPRALSGFAAAPFPAQRCHCMVPKPLEHILKDRGCSHPPSAPGQGNPPQTLISCWIVELWCPGTAWRDISNNTRLYSGGHGSFP